jgi:predicted phage terminase large subunit-like protein
MQTALAKRLSTDGRLDAEILRRKVRRSLARWCLHCGFEPALHHMLLIDRLQKVALGEIDRLAVFMPPGSAKSTYGSILFPPWFMAAMPGASIIAASHTTELAEKWGRRIRNLIVEHGPTLGIALAGDSKAAGRWALTTGGEYYAAGVGVGIAGFRADLAVIDDPIRSREDADSENVREKVWDWYKSDLSTRLRPGGRVVLIQTRWHEDDLAGRALEEMACGRDQWEVVSLPAEAEANDLLYRKPGEWLWDDAYGYAKFLQHEKATQTARNWSALYQQRPAPDTGDYFKEEWLRPYLKVPDRSTLLTYGGSDFAVTANGGDYTVHVVIGIDPEDRPWLLDLWRGQTASDLWVESWCDLVKKWKPNGWGFEQGQIKSGVGPFLVKRARERKTWTVMEDFPTRGDKAVRAQSIRGRMAMMGLHVPTHEAWYPDLRAELLSFPAGKHDDQVDALGLVGQLLDLMGSGQKWKPEDLKVELKNDAYRSVEIPLDGFKTM